MNQLRAVDLTVLALYFGGVVLFGCWFVRRSRSTEGFMAAGRSLPGWAVGLSIFGTYLSSISFLANPGKSLAHNWNPFVFSLSLPIAAWVAVRWFVPFYRKTGEISAYSHLESRFGPWARLYALICYLLTQLVRVGAILYLVALALSPLLGWDEWTIILLTGVLVTVYTLLGGIEAVIWTDVVQSIVLTGGMLVCVVLILTGMPEGPGQVFTIALEHDKFSLGSLGASIAVPTFWVVLLNGIVINLQNFGIDQSYVQRYITARNDREAKRSVWLGALLYLPISALLFFIGTGLYSFYRARGWTLVSTEEGVRFTDAGGAVLEADKVFPWFIVQEVPDGVTGILIAAVLAAAMSSVDSSLNSSASLVLRDVYQRFFRKEAGEKESMRVLHASTLVFGALGTTVALALIGVPSVLDAWWKLSSIFSGGMLGLFLLGLISRKARNPQAVTAVCIGVLAIIWMTLSLLPLWPEEIAWVRSPFHGFLITVVGTATILLVGLLLTLLAQAWGRWRSPDSARRP